MLVDEVLALAQARSLKLDSNYEVVIRNKCGYLFENEQMDNFVCLFSQFTESACNLVNKLDSINNLSRLLQGISDSRNNLYKVSKEKQALAELLASSDFEDEEFCIHDTSIFPDAILSSTKQTAFQHIAKVSPTFEAMKAWAERKNIMKCKEDCELLESYASKRGKGGRQQQVHQQFTSLINQIFDGQTDLIFGDFLALLRNLGKPPTVRKPASSRSLEYVKGEFLLSGGNDGSQTIFERSDSKLYFVFLLSATILALSSTADETREIINCSCAKVPGLDPKTFVAAASHLSMYFHDSQEVVKLGVSETMDLFLTLLTVRRFWIEPLLDPEISELITQLIGLLVREVMLENNTDKLEGLLDLVSLINELQEESVSHRNLGTWLEKIESALAHKAEWGFNAAIRQAVLNHASWTFLSILFEEWPAQLLQVHKANMIEDAFSDQITIFQCGQILKRMWAGLPRNLLSKVLINLHRSMEDNPALNTSCVVPLFKLSLLASKEPNKCIDDDLKFMNDYISCSTEVFRYETEELADCRHKCPLCLCN